MQPAWDQILVAVSTWFVYQMQVLDNIEKAVDNFFESKNELRKLAKNCRTFAERRYSEKNADTIIETCRA